MTTSQSPLRDALGDYLSLRRALGFQLASAGLLGQFVGYLEAHDVDTVTTEHALAWATLPAGASVHWQAIRLSVVRGFAAYLHSIDPSAEVIPAGLLAAARGFAGPPRICIPMPRSARSSGRRPRCSPGCGQPPTRP